MVNFVTIAGNKYLVDVGFGGNGPTHPVPLEEDVATPNIAPASVRLTYKPLTDNVDQTQKLWCYEHRINATAQWDELYCFAETEFLPIDFTIMNYYTSTNRAMFCTFKVLCVRTLMDAHGDIEGLLIMVDGVLKRRIHGETRRLEEMHTEEARVAVLKKYFGIELSEEEQAGIPGLPSALGPGFDL